MAENKNHSIPWSPPEGFVQVDSLEPGVLVYAPQPKRPQVDQAASYACPNCGANIAYDVSAGGVACEYCEYLGQVPAPRLGKAAEDFEFTLDTLSQVKRGWGIQRQVLHCDSCGGELSIPEGALTITCPFCASNQVNVIASQGESFRPRFLIPFKITPEQTIPLGTTWLGKGWYHPDALAENVIVRQFVGIYLPFWTFSAGVDANWRAQVGYQKTEQRYNAHHKRWETHTLTHWVWENGHVHLNVDNLLVTGSAPKHLSHSILEQLYPFQMRDLTAYTPDYLVGWRAQAYETSLTDAWEIGKKTIREQARQACFQKIKSNQVRNFSMSADFQDESWRYILLPVYLAAYKYEGKIYQIMINGQTGSVAGGKPVAWWKVWLAIAAALAPGAFLTLIGLPLILLGGVGVVAIGLGIVLFVVGIVIGFSLYQQARKSEVS